MMQPISFGETLAALFGVDIPNPKMLINLNKVSDQALDAVRRKQLDFLHAVNGKYRNLLELLRGVDAFADGRPLSYLRCIKNINTAFQMDLCALPMGDDKPNLSRWISLSRACAKMPATEHPHLNSFLRARNNRHNSSLLYIEKVFHFAWSRGYKTWALRVMAAVIKDGGNCTVVTEGSIINLCKMLTFGHGPGSGFLGFKCWGPGDHGDPISNLKNHTLIHVCRDWRSKGPDKAGDFVDYGVMEAVNFWSTFRIKLTVLDYDRLAAPVIPLARDCFDGQAPIQGQNLKKFFLYHGLQNQDALINFVYRQAETQYRDFAFRYSQTLRNVLVHSNGTKTFISGSVGDIFIIGRFEGDVLGISSCHYALNIAEKLNGANNNKCWQLK